jgi:hypothetical protein
MTTTADILKKIEQLPLIEKKVVMEETLKAIRKEEARSQLTAAAEELYTEYSTNSELTAFTSLDLENFYEAK